MPRLNEKNQEKQHVEQQLRKSQKNAKPIVTVLSLLYTRWDYANCMKSTNTITYHQYEKVIDRQVLEPW